MTATCSCPVAGWCDRHAINKGDGWHRLCQTRDHYRAAWDAGRGPGQPRNPLTPEQREKKERIQEAAAKQQRLIGWLGLLRHPGEKGVGDTAGRLNRLSGHSHDAHMAIEKLLKQCSCSRTDAVARLNSEYPYAGDYFSRAASL